MRSPLSGREMPTGLTGPLSEAEGGHLGDRVAKRLLAVDRREWESKEDLFAPARSAGSRRNDAGHSGHDGGRGQLSRPGLMVRRAGGRATWLSPRVRMRDDVPPVQNEGNSS